MKKLILGLISIFTLTSCTYTSVDNHNTSNSYISNTTVHIMGDRCYKIKEFHTSPAGNDATFILLDGTKLDCSVGTYIIVHGKCPICAGELTDVR